MRRLLVLFFLFIFFAGCSNTPEGVIPEEKMIDVLTDIHLADGYTTTIVDTPKVIAVYRSVYKTHDIDSLTLRKSLQYYSENTEQLQKIYAAVTLKLQAMEKAEQKKEEFRLKQIEKRAKKTADSLKKVEKLRRDSLKRDSVNKILKKKALLKKDSLKRDSVKKAILKKEKKKNDLPAKRNR